jgi:hypothetical protein
MARNIARLSPGIRNVSRIAAWVVAAVLLSARLASSTCPPYACSLTGTLCSSPIAGHNTTTQPGGTLVKPVRVQTKLHVNTPLMDDLKLLFQRSGLYDPAVPPQSGGYLLEDTYTRIPNGGLYFANTDNQAAARLLATGDGHGYVGLQSSQPSVFPIVIGNVDFCTGLPSASATSTIDISGKDVTLDFTKGNTITVTQDLGGWNSAEIAYRDPPNPSCPYTINPVNLPPNTYQVWHATATFDATSYTLDFLVPLTNNFTEPWNGPYLNPTYLYSFLTEFYECTGGSSPACMNNARGTFFQAFVWDLKAQNEGSSDWIPLTRFVEDYEYDPRDNTTGVRVAEYNGHPALEFSNDGTPTYQDMNTTWDLPNDVSGVPSPLPFVRWSLAQQAVYNNQHSVSLVATLSRSTTEQVQVSLRAIGSAAGYVNHDFNQLTTLTFPPGATTATATYDLNYTGPFPGPTDKAIIYMERSCGAMIGEAPVHTLTFQNTALPTQEPRMYGYTDFGPIGPSGSLDAFVTWSSIPAQDVMSTTGFAFEAGPGGGLGLRRMSGANKAIFFITDYSPTLQTTPRNANCDRVEALSETNCEAMYTWVAGREYRLRMSLGSATGREWIATVLDMETGDETTIGRIRVPIVPGYSNGYGKLIDDSANPRSFLGWLDATLPCGDYPGVSITWRGPYVQDGAYSATKDIVRYPVGQCPQTNGTSLGCPVMRMDAGGGTTHVTPDGTDVWAAAPCPSGTLTNDDFNNAKIVAALPYGDELTTAAATTASDDPFTSGTSCTSSKHSASVWYKYVAATTQAVRVSAVGSDYNTIAAVWTGTRGALTQIGCNHTNTGAGGASQLDFNATAGTTYYVELAGYHSVGGGVGSVRVYPKP